MDGSVVEVVTLDDDRASKDTALTREALWSRIRAEAAGVVQNCLLYTSPSPRD